MHSEDDLYNLLGDVLALLPAGTSPTQTLTKWGKLSASFDPICAGSIERAWPSIYDLCERCGCNAQLVSVDRMEITSLLDTRSGAPNYHTKNHTEVVLVLSDAVEAELKRAA